MTNQQVKEKINKLAKLRKSHVFVYMTSDKEPRAQFGSAIALDTLPLFQEHLYKLGKQKKISLFLYSSGGQLNTPWPLVNLFREYCDEFEVIVPFKALSAATLIALGADGIVMTPFSQLSPIDPIGTFENTENKRESISIEDVTGFISFVKEKVGITEQNALSEALKELTGQIKPSILGSVNRTHSLIRELARKMLKLHNDKIENESVQRIVDNLVEKLFSHEHLINRKEAKEVIGMRNMISYATNAEEKLINDILHYYQDILEINKPLDPLKILGSDIEKEYKLVRAIISGPKQEMGFVSKYKITKTPSPKGQAAININAFYNSWEKL